MREWLEGRLYRGLGLTHWLVLRARSGSERKAVEGLAQAGFQVYLPQETRWGSRPRKGERQKVYKALLPGYIFAPYAEGFSFYEALAVEGVTGFLPSLLPDQAVSEIRTRESAGDFDYAKDRRKAQKAKRRAMKLTEFAGLDRETILSELQI